MASEDRPSNWWIVVGILVSLACCLCLALTGGSTLLSLVSITPVPTVSIPFPEQPTMPAQFPEQPTMPAQFPEQPTAEAGVMEATVQILSSTEIPIADPVSLAERLKGLSNIPRVLATEADPIPEGTEQTFWVSNNDENTNFQVAAEMVYASDHVYFWVQLGVEYDLDEVRQLVDDFERKTYPTVRTFFGSEWTPGVDGDPHLYMLLAGGLGTTTAGYFGSTDGLSPIVHPYSNAHEMFYLNSDIQRMDDFTYGTLAHELQHMIHYYHDVNEESWVNEGFADIASLLTGHDIGGHDWAYAADPDQTLGSWPSGEDSLPHYGQSFLFLAYFLGRLGPQATQALVANPANGLHSIDLTLEELGITDSLTGDPITADDLYADWAAALLLQDPTVSDGRYQMSAYPPAAYPQFADRFGSCPVNNQVRQVSQYGVDYIQITCEGDLTLSFEGTTRAQVTPEGAHSGDYAFWSNKGDTSDMTLTRGFDLRQAQAPITFDYWVWYDLEDGWDYVYLEASSDGGQSWEILTTPSGTGTNPSGNSYGWGYTGMSGGDPARWILETVDLSAFAGQQILLRFEYVTDAVVNGEGLQLDDLSIQAISYTEDFEQTDGGWEAAGFVRLRNTLPQAYRVLLIERGTRTRVRQIELDAQGKAQATMSLGETYDEAILVVIATGRYTWQPATYRFQVH